MTEFIFCELSPRARRHAFVYTGWNVLKETIREGAVTRTKHYVWGLDQTQDLISGAGVGALIAIVDSETGLLHAQADGAGNVTQLVEPDGDIAAHYEYDAFGRVVAMSGVAAQDNAFRYSTKYTDDETGLLYYGYRYYSAAIGRWTSRDSIEELGGPNLYGFVGNSPLLYFDLLGLCDIEQIAKNAILEIGKAKAKEIALKQAAKSAAKFAFAAVVDGPLPIGEIIGGTMFVYDMITTGAQIKALLKGLSSLESQILKHLTPDLKKALLGKIGDCCDKFAADMVQVVTAKMARRGVGSEVKKAFSELKDCCNIRKGVQKNKRDGVLREQRVRKKLESRFGEKQVLRERELLDHKGDKVIGPDGTGRRVDFVVLDKDGKRGKSVEVTSHTADKDSQIRNEREIRKDGGHYVRHPETGELIDIGGTKKDMSRIIRVK